MGGRGKQEINKEVISIMQRNDYSLDQNESGRDLEKGCDSVYIFKVEIIGFAELSRRV